MDLNESLILYIDDIINNNDELFFELSSFSSHIDEDDSIEDQKLTLCSELVIFGETIDEHYISKNVYDTFSSLIKEKNYFKAFELLIHEWKYAYIEVSSKLTLYPDRLNRKMKMPLRYTLDEVAISVLSSYRSDLCHYFVIYNGRLGSLLTLLEVENEGKEYDSSTLDDISFSLFIQDFASCVIIYDYSEKYQIRCSFDLKYHNDEEMKSAKVIEGKGYGIYEDNLDAFFNYLEDSESLNIVNMKTNKESIPFDVDEFSLENINKRIEIDVYDGVKLFSLLKFSE